MTISYKAGRRIQGISTDRTGIESSQGYAGGDCSANAKSGGGGAGAVGNPQSGTNVGGDGGAGLSSSITGSAVTRAGGGGGASWSSSTNSSGGTGGGGAGSQNAGTAGTVNTGSGGGGGGESGGNKTGGNGGSGIVILRFTTSGNGYDTPTGTHSVATDGSYTVISWTAGSGTFTPTSSYDVEYLVIAGGGGGGGGLGGGGGAGGYRTATGFGVTSQSYTITVGAGGAGAVANASKGGDSVFSTITSEGGGLGTGEAGGNGGDGGSGGGTGTNSGSGGTSATYVSTPATIPTNVQVGSRFEETDTQKMYHKVDTVTGADVSLTGLKAYYKFNEASGNIINQASAVGSTDMIATSDLVVSGATYGVTGKIGDALSFDGTNDSASASSTSTSDWSFLSQSGVAFTIIFWYKADDFVANRSFFATSNFGTDGINIVSKTDRYIRFLCGNTSAGFMDFTTTTVIQPNDTNWHMLMAKYDDASGVGTLSIDNGIVETKGSQNLTNTSSPNYVFKVAQDGLGAGYYKGDIDEFSIWNRILTTAEITSLYNSGIGIAINTSTWSEEGT